MFLKNIHIKNYNQFENLFLDLTYPAGHEKEGKPLEKICIIGDNGTGKTTLLELIRDYYEFVSKFHSVEGVQNILQQMPEKYPDESGEVLCHNLHDTLTRELRRDAKILFFPIGIKLPTLIEERDSEFEQEVSEDKLPYKSIRDLMIDHRGFRANKFIYDLNNIETIKIWEELRSYIKRSIDKELEYRRSLLEGMSEQSEPEIDQVYKKFKAYKKENPNGLDEFASFLNPVLEKFHLRLNTEINLKEFNKVEFLSLRTKDHKVIPREKWSTGIRQLIDTTLPLYSIKPKTGVILIDEPENSLYPNTQRMIVDFYRSICPKMQFIFATHSPIIASSFEPWEVIELKFNEKGKVERKLYYKGEENHVDNYNIHPMYLTWNSLFMDMFGVMGESNDARTEKLMELAMLDNEVKKTTDKSKKKELFKKYEKIAKKLAWRSL